MTRSNDLSSFSLRYSDGDLLLCQYLSCQHGARHSSSVESKREEARCVERARVILVLSSSVASDSSADHSCSLVIHLPLSLSSRTILLRPCLCSSQLQRVASVDSPLGDLFDVLLGQVSVRSSSSSLKLSLEPCRMTVMVFKGLLIIYPLSSQSGHCALTYRRRGSYFSLIEHVSQFYISLLTIRPWVEFLLNKNQSNLFFSSFLLLFYAVVKVMPPSTCSPLRLLLRVDLQCL